MLATQYCYVQKLDRGSELYQSIVTKSNVLGEIFIINVISCVIGRVPIY